MFDVLIGTVNWFIVKIIFGIEPCYTDDMKLMKNIVMGDVYDFGWMNAWSIENNDENKVK